MPRLTPVSRRKFEKFLKFVGCSFKRQKGDHLIYDRPGLKRPIVVPEDKEVPIFIIRNNLRTLKISPQDYLEILGKL
ncbi:type II toxin-antitoxin system HicA family toxin [Candidatus Parcubacteria bacterium]|nr:type II toxin-antitoxin system HicA family toxin [Candidatus Parcubacteria bacterium]